jgi:hypothetical protein
MMQNPKIKEPKVLGYSLFSSIMNNHCSRKKNGACNVITQISVGTSHMNINQHMSVAMQRLVDFISVVTQQYVTTQQSCNALLAGISVCRYIRNSPLLCNG